MKMFCQSANFLPRIAEERRIICNAIRLGIPTNVIMEWTGHSDYKAMKPYIKIVDAVKEENMSKFDTFSEERRSNSKK